MISSNRLLVATATPSVRRAATILSSSVSGLPEKAPAGFGFLMRPMLVAGTPVQSAEQLTDLVGKVPLKGMVRDATDKVERLCIEATRA